MSAVRSRAASAALLREALARGAALRAGAIRAERTLLRGYQAARLARTHADLLASPRFGAAARFFLTDLYGPGASASRYDEAAQVMPLAVRMLPAPGLSVLADAWRLDALTEMLDAAVIAALPPGTLLDDAAYAAAYQAADDRPAREAQIAALPGLARALDHFARNRAARVILTAMREPARLAGFGSLQGFLERGLVCLHAMRGVDRFVNAIAERERVVMQRLFAGDASVLRWVPSAIAGD